ncbi:GNAT family N-acetyltransferase [Variovorax saccharolyticus]|uniref:GNAT family N-acetyltransferase n=1 Tax=Variovorax saccharolyticus TaxID=3053516 RepID=UPI002576CB39|nr:GNAT family N-acetyltransferase [Variovorax sp. J22R187]MDM0021626.1 GNAT family N-acetyltransferase [Variovorax sp. J22R187]
MSYQISTARTVTWQEFAELMESVGWGGGYDEESFERSYRAYPLVVHARADDGVLLGYVSAFSDGVFSTMLGELVVRPTAQGSGIGRALLKAVEAEFPGVPVYVKAMGEAKRFFEACGYRRPTTEMTVMFKKPSAGTR